MQGFDASIRVKRGIKTLLLAGASFCGFMGWFRFTPVLGHAANAPVMPPAPRNLALKIINHAQIDLTWTDVSTDEDGYKIERRSGTTEAFKLIATICPNFEFFSDTSRLAEKTKYFYRIRAYKHAGEYSDYSNIVSGTTLPAPPPAPGNLAATAVSKIKIDLVWQDNAANEDSFKIERKIGGSAGARNAAGNYVKIAVVGANVKDFSDPGLTLNTEYFYRVRACNAGGYSNYSNEVSATTWPDKPAAPGDLTATTISHVQIDLAWQDHATNEDSFKIERKAGTAGKYIAVAGLGADSKSFSDTELAPNTEYFYRLRAFNRGGRSDYSNEANATTFRKPPGTPGNLTVTTAGHTRIVLTWQDNASNEDGFKLERKKDATGVYAQLAQLGPDARKFIDSTLAANTVYFYRLRAFNNGGQSDYSNEASAATLPDKPAAPGNLTAATVSHAQINLAWQDNATNEDSFKIDRKAGAAGKYIAVAGLGAGSKNFSDTGLAPNTEYFYRLRASNRGGRSDYSNEANATTFRKPPGAPGNLTATVAGNTRIVLAWQDKASNEDGFKIERKKGATGAYVQLAQLGPNARKFADSTLAANTLYFYRLRAFNNGGQSDYSNDASAATLPDKPAAPGNLTAVPVSNTQINLAWQDNSANEDSFKIERKLGAAGTYKQIAALGANAKKFSDATLAANTRYFYRVRAYNRGGYSAYSNEASAILANGANFALNKPAEASSTDSTSAAGRGNDGDATTFWHSRLVNSAGAEVTYQVQLHPSLAITVGRVVVRWHQTYFATEYDIQVSKDARNWTTVRTKTGVGSGVQEAVFAATPAKYVRIITRKNNQSSYRIAELEVYGATAAKSVGETAASVPEIITLERNYPNPFSARGTTTIAFALPAGMHVTVKVINVAGQEVALLVDGYRDRGIHRVTFNGRKLPSGVYYAVMKAGETTQTQRMVLAK